MRRIFIISLLLLTGIVSAQQRDDLYISDYDIINRTGIFGVERLLIAGQLKNATTEAQTNISIEAVLQDDASNIIGEAFGFAVNACGEALLDFALQPGHGISFEAAIDLYEDVEITNVDFDIFADVIAPESEDALDTNITEITREEVVAVEWLDTNTLRYGVGCHRDLFLEHDWYEYSLETDTTNPVTHPGVDIITEQFIEVTKLDFTGRGEPAPEQVAQSAMSISPDMNRIIYQTETHTMMSAEPPGYFRGIVHSGLNQYSLQGIYWTAQNVFLAYYYGAYGDPVRYFSAGATGVLRSATLWETPLSVTVPGISPDGLSAVIGTDIDDVEGYYLMDITGVRAEVPRLLTAMALPGNNYPAPLYMQQNGQTFVYIVHDANGETVLQCFAVDEPSDAEVIKTPLMLQSDERAWAWLSPDHNRLALAANGRQAGLWVIDVTQIQATCSM